VRERRRVLAHDFPLFFSRCVKPFVIEAENKREEKKLE